MYVYTEDVYHVWGNEKNKDKQTCVMSLFSQVVTFGDLYSTHTGILILSLVDVNVKKVVHTSCRG